jgi:alpha-galactosidase
VTIEWREGDRQLHLTNGSVSYVMRVLQNDSLAHLYFGPALALNRSYAQLGPKSFSGFANRLDEPVPFEYPTGGTGDFRIPALIVEQSDGSSVLQLRYAGHSVRAGKSPLHLLPSTYVESDREADSVEVMLEDARSGIRAELLFTIFKELPVIARSARIHNGGSEPATLRCAMSASLDLPESEWRFLHLSGAWGRERHVIEGPLTRGQKSIGSVRGASGHQHNPFLALCRPHTTEAAGECIGLSLVYSGNFLAEVEVDIFDTCRIRLGINPDAFYWRLEPGDTFVVPEAVLAHSSQGLDDLSDAFHRLYRKHLVRGVWRDQVRPVLINNWEATFFDFTEEKIVELAEAGRELGMELFVLDDGWFGNRNDDTSSLGDWTVNLRKLPSGIDGLARQIEALGMKFGIWVEPEMVSQHSALFEAHPDWAVGIPGRAKTESRNQYVLDFTRAEVVDHLCVTLSDLLSSAPITYVKWDMNRDITEPFSSTLPARRQGEFFHRYMLGVYELYARLTAAFPTILFESCAGGGGRFDPGLLAFAPLTWASDNTDPVERLKIQWGTSICYPLDSMAAHVSPVPNHQVGRVTPIDTRAAVAFFGVLGYEIDLTRLTDEERAAIRNEVAFYKEHRQLFQRGRLRRLLSPFGSDASDVAWMVVADDRSRAIVGHYRVLNRPNPWASRLRLRGLDSTRCYRVSPWPADRSRIIDAGAQRGGDELMSARLVLEENRSSAALRGDFASSLFVLDAI